MRGKHNKRNMLILGVFIGKDSGVALIENGFIRYAANEERFSRNKMHTGFPHLALRNMFAYTGVSPQNVQRIAFGGLSQPSEVETVGYAEGEIDPFRKKMGLVSRYLGGLMETDFAYRLFLAFQRIRLDKSGIEAQLRSYDLSVPIHFIDHHLAHAYSAYFSAGFSNCLLYTSDGGGDGCSGGVYVASPAKVERIAYTPRIHSAGNFWMYITILLGMDPWKHGGKVTGLAAYEPCREAYETLRKFYSFSSGRFHFINKNRLFLSPAIEHLREIMKPYNPAQIAYAAQKVLEENMVGAVRAAVKKLGQNQLALAGGTFGNVRLNQALFTLPEVQDGFVHPNMGDGGIALGAAYALWHQECTAEAADWVQNSSRMENAYLGPHFTEDEICAILEGEGFIYDYYENDLANVVAAELSADKVVAYFAGRMEYGPRALGHRSILYGAKEPAVNDWLNKRLKRSEYMPFAPVVTEETAHLYFNGLNQLGRAARFMTVTCDCTPLMKQRCPAAVHVDGTARPQILEKKENPGLYAILEAYGALTGDPVVVNTSFNMHEEPIVHSPVDALRAFTQGNLDVLVMERFVIRKSRNENRFN